jgi:hypothetical protein
VVADAYEIPLPAGTPPGDYVPLVIVYEPETGAEIGRALLDPVYLEGNPVPPPDSDIQTSVAQASGACLGDLRLVGLTPPVEYLDADPGASLSLTLLWQARRQPTGRYAALFWLEGAERISLSDELVGGAYPTGRWQAGQAVRQSLQWPVPAVENLGVYRLKMRVLRDGQPLPWGNCLIPLGSDLLLGSVHLMP